MKNISRFLAFVTLFPSFADAVDKDQYSLFKPTPQAEMRDMTGDDITEAAQTVDAGHFQFECNFFEYGFSDRPGDSETKRFTAVPSLLKIGLTNDTELQLGFTPYSIESERLNSAFEKGPWSDIEGPSKMSTRAKMNLFGNDEGRTALGIVTSVSFPITRSDVDNHYLEGGAALLYGMEINAANYLATMLALDLSHHAEDGHELGTLHSASLTTSISEKIDIYLEYAGYYSDSELEPYINSGVTWLVNSEVMIDFLGLKVGLNDNAEDIVFFTAGVFRY
ncbi:hypothetical protein JNK13_04835 [bacterium]|nr:hypothetical protein [bacterium]